jgi:chemotaxis signal transduction protein
VTATGTDPSPLLERIRDLEVELATCRLELERISGPGDEGRIPCLEVTLPRGRFLVPVQHIREVVSMAGPTPLAGSPPWVMGTIPYGARTVPVIDLGLRLGGAETPLSPDLLLVILDSPMWLALAVGDVGRVLEIAAGDLHSPPPEVPAARFLVAVYRAGDGDVASVLSPARLAGEDDG